MQEPQRAPNAEVPKPSTRPGDGGRRPSNRRREERPVDTKRVDAVLAWAAEVAEDPQAIDGPTPPRPTPGELRAYPLDRLRPQLDDVIVHRNADHALEALQRMGVFAAWIPEVDAMVGFGDGEWRHKDVWKHTKQVVKQAVPRLAVRWGALLHDIGKPKTRSVDARGEVHFYGHSEVGAAMFRKRVAKRLGFEGFLYERIHFLILHHLRASQYEPKWTDSAVRRLAKEMGDGLDDLLCLSRADITTKRPERRRRGLRQISALARRIADIQAQDAKVAPLPKGLGTAIIDHFGIPPSKRVGDLKKVLEAKVDAGELEPGQDDAYYVAWMDAHRDELGL